MKKFRLFLLMLSAAVLPFTACQTGGEGVDGNGDGNGDPATPAGPVVLTFFADVASGNGKLEQGQSLSGMNLPGHMFYASSANGDEVMMVLFDYDFQSYGCESYSYLTAHDTPYPLVAGSVNEDNLPRVSCVLADPGYTNFLIGGKMYYPVVPESPTDAEGAPYGVWVMTQAMEGVDNSMLSFYLPAVDDDGNSVTIQGSYTGPLGYELSGAPVQTYPFNLNDFGYTEFAATQEGDKLTLKSSNGGGDLVFVLDLAQNNGELASTWMALEDGTGSLTGHFFDPLDGEFPITSGQFSLEATETPGQYTLVPSPRNPVLFVGPHTKELDSSVDYTITVTGLTPATPAGPVVLTFFADVASGNGKLEQGQSLSGMNLPGHMFYAATPNGDEVMMVLFDYDFQSYGCESYSYLTAHDTPYPLVAGSVNEDNLPRVSCVLADPGYTNFSIGGKMYYPVVPESPTDAEGAPYGVWVMTQAMEGVDNNMLSFYLPAVDDDGNSVTIQGSYTGPLGYELSGGPVQTYPFNLNDFGYTEFAATKEGDILKLVSQSSNGNLVLKLDLAQNNGEVEGTWMALEDGSGNLNGFYWDAMEDVDFNITTGQFTLTATETPGQYTLVPSPRNPVLFVGPHTKELDSSVDYTITVTGL